MSVTLSSAAADRARRFLGQRAHAVGLRLGVRSTGCSGYAYEVEVADQVGPDDLVFESEGIQVVVDRASLPLLDGTHIDFGRDGLNEGFRYHNPNVKSQCGCGESFGV